MRAIVTLAQKLGSTDMPVLIAGATGTGKEVVAELIHANSQCKSKEMVCLNCAGLPAELIESELFGSARGAFTGSSDRVGLIKHAEGSTVFLDELSEMPLQLQSKLLRFLQDKRVRRVGAVTSEVVNVRILAAVNKEPRFCIQEKTLREDLYYRLSAVTIIVPLLRNRPEDIMPLAATYLNYFSEEFKRKPPILSSKIEKALVTYRWPGNVRELKNEMNRCALLCGDSVNLEDLSILPNASSDDHIEIQEWVAVDISKLSEIDRSELAAIVNTFIACQFNKVEACKRLGIGRQTLYNKIHRYGIKNQDRDARRIRMPATSAQPAEQIRNVSAPLTNAPSPSLQPAVRAPRKDAPGA